jgi:hypothetical protein
LRQESESRLDDGARQGDRRGQQIIDGGAIWESFTRLAPALIAAELPFGLATASAQTSPAKSNEKLTDENLLVAVPDGYKIDFQQRSGNMLISEMVPDAQTVADWTEMVTVQVFHVLKVTPEQLKARIDEEGLAACDGIQSNPVAQGDENGYAYMVWLQSCPLNKATGKPEITWFKGHCRE